MTLPRHPDDDSRITALDGRVLDVAVSARDETVAVVVLGTDTLTLTSAGARALARLLVSGCEMLDEIR